jgi:spermidine synthase
MTASEVQQPARTSAGSPVLPVLLLLFFGSGAAALIYQIVWFQLLSLIIGSSAISLGVLLATFMGGMCIGSLGLSHVISARQHPLRIYALIEFGIALFGLIVLFALPWVGGLYMAIGGSGVSGLILRAALAAVCLLPPTILMGATLPAIARWVEATPQGVAWLGFFYGGNIAGAVFGSLLAGFYLLRVHDMTIATLVAVSLNVAVGLAGFVLSLRTRHRAEGVPARTSLREALASIAPGSEPVLIVTALSGLTGLAAEVVWTRLLSLTMGATVYTFSLILAAFLLGLGIGSSAGSFFARTLPNPRVALGWCQLLLMAGLAWAAYSLTQALPYWPINPAISSSPWFTFQVDFVRALWTVLPAALLWGASFPLALAAVADKKQDPGHLVGIVYAANTLGAIIGSLTAALLIIGSLGTQTAQRLLIVLAAISAILALVLVTSDTGKIRLRSGAAGWAAGIVALAVLFASTVAQVPGVLVGYGRYAATWIGYHGEFIYTGEGTHASLAVSRMWNGVLNYHNAGKVQASSEPQDMRLQRMLGHLTTLLPENPKEVLVIGFGAGVTAGAVSIDPRVERVTIAEIERLVPEVVSTYFSEHNYNVARNPKTNIQIDDARHFLLTTDQKFDAITSDPFDPWVKGAATLYTAEFFELMKKRLNPGGVVTIFVQLYESGLDAVKSEVATFVEAFPNATVWANTLDGQGYDVVLLGQVEPTRINIPALEERLARPEYEPVRQSLIDTGFYTLEELLSTYAGRGPDLLPWLADAQINRDRNLRLQYLAGMNLNRREADLTYRQMVSYLTWPDDLFIGPAERVSAIRFAVTGSDF